MFSLRIPTLWAGRCPPSLPGCVKVYHGSARFGNKKSIKRRWAPRCLSPCAWNHRGSTPGPRQWLAATTATSVALGEVTGGDGDPASGWRASGQVTRRWSRLLRCPVALAGIPQAVCVCGYLWGPGSSLGEASGRKPEGNGAGLVPRGRKGGSERGPVSPVPPFLTDGGERAGEQRALLTQTPRARFALQELRPSPCALLVSPEPRQPPSWGAAALPSLASLEESLRLKKKGWGWPGGRGSGGRLWAERAPGWGRVSSWGTRGSDKQVVNNTRCYQQLPNGNPAMTSGVVPGEQIKPRGGSGGEGTQHSIWQSCPGLQQRGQGCCVRWPWLC